MYGLPPSRFEFLFGYLNLPDDVEKNIREKLLAFKVLREGGKTRLRADITAENYSIMCQVHEAVVEQIRMIVEKYLS